MSSKHLKQSELDETLYDAVGIGLDYAVEGLLAKGADINYIHRDHQGQPLGSVLDLAVHERDFEMVELLLRHDAKIGINCPILCPDPPTAIRSLRSQHPSPFQLRPRNLSAVEQQSIQMIAGINQDWMV